MSTPPSFGNLLRTLRKRVGMTQGDLAAAVGYSVSAISALEQGRRLPDIDFVGQRLLPALAVTDEPSLARRLVELAAATRGERPPTAITSPRTVQATPPMAALAFPGRLPPLATPLIGRTAQVNQLCDRLLGHSGRLLTLVGPPGIGKTTLALAVAAQAQPYYDDGVVFVALAAISDATSMASAIANAVGCSDAGPKPPQTKLIECLRRKNMLLVLDNLEQLLSPPLSGEGAGVGLIAALVAECPGIAVLATSRERLHLRTEQRFKVPPLDLAAAVELFVQRAHAVDADFSLSTHNQPTVAAICQRLDCLPLALELCAAQVDMFAPAQLLTHLQVGRLDLLVDGAHDLPPHQRTLRIAIQRSYDLLDEAERTLFRSLSVFVGGFDLAAVAAMSDWGLASGENNDSGFQSLTSRLHALIGKSLVRVETTPEGEQRFLLLETIRAFALEQVRTHGEEAQLRQRHYVAYLRRFRVGDTNLRRSEGAMWLQRLRLDRDNLRAALQWTLGEAHYADAAWLMMAVSYFWVLSGDGDEEARWLTQLLPHRQTLAPDLRLTILLTFYRTASTLQEFQPLDRWMGEVMALLDTCEDKLLRAFAWSLIANTLADVGEATAARERGIALARATDEAPGLSAEFGAFTDQNFVLATYLAWYAEFLIEQGEFVRAASMARESLERAQAQGHHWGIGDGYGMLGRLALLRGDLAQAQLLFHKAVTIATAFNFPLMQCNWQPFLGIVTLYSGDVPEARRLLNETLHRSLDLKNIFRLSRSCTYLAEAALWEGQLDQAEQWLVQSLGYHIDARRITTEAVQRLWVAARLATAQQQYPRAATLFGLAEQAHGQIHHAIGGPMRALADAALATVQAALEPAVFAEAFTAGQQMTLAGAFATLIPSPDIQERLGRV